MPRRPTKPRTPSRRRYTRRQRRAKAAVRGLWTFLMPGIGLVVAWAADLSNLLGCSEYIEMVLKRSGDYLICIGGNTSPTGQNANGGMVAMTKRHKSEVTKIGRRVL